MRGHIRHGNKGKARINVLRCAVSDHIASNQVAEDTTYKCIRGEMFPGGHSGHAYRGGKSVGRNLGRLVWIFGCYYSCERPASNCVARREAVRECTRTVRPESAGTISFIWSLSVRCQFYRFCAEARVDDGFCSQTPSFCKMVIVGQSSNHVER